MSADQTAERLTTAISRLEAVTTARMISLQQERDRALQDASLVTDATATINGLNIDIEKLKAERDAQATQINSLRAAQTTDQTLAAENQRLRTALEEALSNVDTILAELNGKV